MMPFWLFSYLNIDCLEEEEEIIVRKLQDLARF